MDLRRTFQGKKVFLTGHTGFKGSWMLLILRELGAEVKGYALPPKQEHDLYHAISGDEHCESLIADIRDRDRVAGALLDFRPDFVFHMAAQALVIDSYHYPVETFATNVMGTVHVMDALRQLKTPCVSVIITTDKVYENFEVDTPYPESARLGGYDTYSNSKACAELAISSYRNSFMHPGRYDEHRQSLASVRSGNVIGGGDWSDNRLVPDIARALIAGEEIVLRNPRSVRPWQHVLDPLNGYLSLAAHMATDPVQFATAYNFGPRVDDVRTVEDMCKLALQCWGSGSYRVEKPENPLHEAGLLKLSIDKAGEELSWQPRFSSAEAVEWTMRWYKDGRDNALRFTRDQITEYFQLK